MRTRCPKCHKYETTNPRRRRVLSGMTLAIPGFLILLQMLRGVFTHFGFLLGGCMLLAIGIMAVIIGIGSPRGYCRQCDLRFDPDTVEPRPLDRLL